MTLQNKTWAGLAKKKLCLLFSVAYKYSLVSVCGDDFFHYCKSVEVVWRSLSNRGREMWG